MAGSGQSEKHKIKVTSLEVNLEYSEISQVQKNQDQPKTQKRIRFK